MKPTSQLGLEISSESMNLPEEYTFLRLPSISTICLAMILVLTFVDIITLESASLPIATWVTLLFPLAIIVAGMRMFLTFPDTFIRKLSQSGLSDAHNQFPTLAKAFNELASQMGVSPVPTLLSSESEVSLQAFGTFKRRYIVISKSTLEDAENSESVWQTSLKPAFAHELAHFLTGDYWKIKIVIYLVRVFFIFILSIIVFGSFAAQQFRTGSIEEQAIFLLNGILSLTFCLLTFWTIRVMVIVREYTADAWNVVVHGDSNIVRTSLLDNIAVVRSPFLTLCSRIFGNFDDVVWSNKSMRERIRLLHSADFQGPMLKVVLLAGFTIGSLFLSPNRFIVGLMLFLAVTVGIYMISSYSLYGLLQLHSSHSWLVVDILISTATFTSGICGYVAIRGLAIFVVRTLSGGYRDRLLDDLLGHIYTIGYIGLVGLILFLAIVFTSPSLRRTSSLIKKSKDGTWLLVGVNMIQAFSYFTILTVLLLYSIVLTTQAELLNNLLFWTLSGFMLVLIAILSIFVAIVLRQHELHTSVK